MIKICVFLKDISLHINNDSNITLILEDGPTVMSVKEITKCLTKSWAYHPARSCTWGRSKTQHHQMLYCAVLEQGLALHGFGGLFPYQVVPLQETSQAKYPANTTTSTKCHPFPRCWTGKAAHRLMSRDTMFINVSNGKPPSF